MLSFYYYKMEQIRKNTKIKTSQDQIDIGKCDECKSAFCPEMSTFTINYDVKSKKTVCYNCYKSWEKDCLL